MRIIAGEARGRRIEAPPGLTTRPILDQLKARTFDILGPIPARCRVWDLFAGAGSLGLEALSRGAGSCVFVDGDRQAVRTIERNLATLGWTDRARVRRADALQFAGEGEGAPGLIFCDPPFPLVEGAPEAIAALLERLFLRLDAGGRLVYRAPSRPAFPTPAALAEHADVREHGVNRLVIVSATG